MAFAAAWGIATVIVGGVCTLLLLLLATGDIATPLRLAGLIAVPLLFLGYLYAGYRIFRLFGGMFDDHRRDG